MILQYGLNYVYSTAPLVFSHVSEGNLEVSALDGTEVTSDPKPHQLEKIILVCDGLWDLPAHAQATYITSMYIDNNRLLVYALDFYPE